MANARTIAVGGFPGAGKTTALIRLASRLRVQGHPVQLDVRSGTPEHHLIASLGLDSSPSPSEVHLCEVSTAACMLVDPLTAEASLGFDSTASLPATLMNAFAPHLRSASIIVLNKIDLLDAPRLDRLTAALAKLAPQARILPLSSRSGAGFDEWAEQLFHIPESHVPDQPLPLASVTVHAAVAGLVPFDANALIAGLAVDLHRRLKEAAVGIVHLKLVFRPDDAGGVTAVNLVGGHKDAEASHGLSAPVESGQLALQLQGAGAAEQLHDLVEVALEDMEMAKGVTIETSQFEATAIAAS